MRPLALGQPLVRPTDPFGQWAWQAFSEIERSSHIQFPTTAAIRLELSPLDYGAVGNDPAKDGPAFIAWIAALTALHAEYGAVAGAMPPGVFDLTTITESLAIPGNSNFTIRGAGSAATKLLIGNTFDLFSKVTGTAESSYLQFSGFTVQGPGGGTANDGPSAFGTINKVTDVVLNDLILRDMGSLMSAFRNCKQITTNGCRFERGGRGALNIAECNASVTSNCHFVRLGDDAISLHERFTAAVSGNHSVTGCRFFMSQGIKGVGGRNIAVTGNHFEFMAGYALSVESQASLDTEGANAGMNVSFTGNTVKDTFNNNFTTAHNGARIIVRLGGLAANAYGLDDVPGYPADDGTMVRPEDYYANYDDDGTTAIPPSINYNVSNNVIIQSLPEATNFSDLGYGDFWGYEGEEVDPAVARADLLSVDFMLLEGYLNNVVVGGNVITGVFDAFQFASSNSEELRLRNILITGNIIQDLQQFVIDTQSALAFDPDGLDVTFTGNLVDADPYLSSSNRNADGSWTSIAANTAGLFIGARGNDCSQIRVFGNTFKNIAAVTDVTHYGNTYLCEPTVIGALNAGNLGVGQVPFGDRVMLIDSDPASVTYGAIINTMVETATAMPATGTYVAGHIVRNSAPAVAGGGGSKYVVTGWLRLTTGSAHVADTDWAEQRTLTGT